jgi:cytochrome c-type biogenesis protein CcmH/NrfG
MSLRAWNVVVLAAALGLWLASGTQREKPVLTQAKSDTVRVLETQVAAHPTEAKGVLALAQAYLDAQSPGLAVAVIEASPADVRADARVDHLYARSLVAQGRNQDALAAERRVLTKCATDTCDAYLIASATRRADILQQLVNLGVEDSQAQPEASRVAYYNATRQVGLVQ